MIIVMKPTAEEKELEAIIHWVELHDRQVHLSHGKERTIVGVIGDGRPLEKSQVEVMEGVEKVMPILAPYKLASRTFRPDPTLVPLNINAASTPVAGAEQVVVIAGPCSVENRSQLLETAHAVKEAGAVALRGGAFKPRSSPYSFQGMGEAGLELMAEAREQTGLAVVTEVMAAEQLPLVTRYADVLQVGARNMQNYHLLKALGYAEQPVLLKRGLMSTMEELLLSVEYVLAHGNPNVMLCERGIRTFETYTRNTLDINAVPVLKRRTHLPVVVDPSHATGSWELVEPAALAAVAAGADGLIIEVHPCPEQALSDGRQSLKPERFAELIERARAVAAAVGRTL